RIFANRSGHDECLGVVDNERCKCASRTFDNRFLAFDEIQHIHAAVCVVRNGLGEPMSSRLDEFALVQSGAFLAPAVTAAERFKTVDEIALCPVRGSLPLDVRQAVLEMNRARTTDWTKRN